jgi:hypothetical protein
MSQDTLTIAAKDIASARQMIENIRRKKLFWSDSGVGYPINRIASFSIGTPSASGTVITANIRSV